MTTHCGDRHFSGITAAAADDDDEMHQTSDDDASFCYTDSDRRNNCKQMS